MKKLIKNKYANFYLNAADALGLKYTILNKKIGLVRIFNETTKLDISSNVLSVNSQLSSSLSSNKVKTSTLLQAGDIPAPTFKTFRKVSKATDYALEKLENKKLVVIKPINGSLSIGITVNPSSVSQINSAVEEAFVGNSSIMIEEYIRGRHFRVTVLDGTIIAITERLAANVTGNGKSTVVKLIEQKNIQREKNNLPAIFLRPKDLDYLKKEKIELSKIYPEGVLITLQLGCNLDIGGERVRIDKDLVPEINNQLFAKAAKALGLRFAGIDYITPDIMTPHTKIVTAINEINSAPDLDVHYRDSTPNDNYAAIGILTKIFSQKIIVGKEKLTPLPFTQQVLVTAAKNIQTN